MTIFRYRSAHHNKSSDSSAGRSLAGWLIKRCKLYRCGLAILAGFVALYLHQETPRRSANQAGRSHGGKMMRLFDQKNL